MSEEKGARKKGGVRKKEGKKKKKLPGNQFLLVIWLNHSFEEASAAVLLLPLMCVWALKIVDARKSELLNFEILLRFFGEPNSGNPQFE